MLFKTLNVEMLCHVCGGVQTAQPVTQQTVKAPCQALSLARAQVYVQQRHIW